MVGMKRKRGAATKREELSRSSYAQSTEDAQEGHHGSKAVENVTPRSILKKRKLIDNTETTPQSNRKLLFATPTKSNEKESSQATPTIVHNADRSARRRSNRQLILATIGDEDVDEEGLEAAEILAKQILSDGDEEAVLGDLQEESVGPPAPETPVKRGRGRPKGSGKSAGQPKKSEPTSPQQLPAHEEYFWQNRLGGAKTSNNTLTTLTLLNHDEYFSLMKNHQDHHRVHMDRLLELHSRAFDQWIFELREGFNICLYGYGSKRQLTQRFTEYLYEHLLHCSHYQGSKKTPKIVVINGYVPGTTPKEILNIIASTILPKNAKLPNQLNPLLAYILGHLTDNPPPHPIPVILNSIDSISLRKPPTPRILATLAAHPHINLVCTANTPIFHLLWDVGYKAQYKFLHHDATTFASYDAEISVVETVNELLGRSGRRIGGKDGIGFVLRSLPENARLLFRILVTEQLGSMMNEDIYNHDDDAEETPISRLNAVSKRTTSDSLHGIEYRVLYHKAVEDFVCSNEVGFRTLLKEFHDHQMIESRKDAMGTERLWIPFRQEELENLAQDLFSE